MMPREITGSCTVHSSRRGLSCIWTPAAPSEGLYPPPVNQTAAARSWPASLPSWTLRKDPRRCAASVIRVRDSRPRPPPGFFPVPLRASSFFLGGISALGGDGAPKRVRGGPSPTPLGCRCPGVVPEFAQLHIATMTAAAIGCLFCCFYFTLAAISAQRRTR